MGCKRIPIHKRAMGKFSEVIAGSGAVTAASNTKLLDASAGRQPVVEALKFDASNTSVDYVELINGGADGTGTDSIIKFRPGPMGKFELDEPLGPWSGLANWPKNGEQLNYAVAVTAGTPTWTLTCDLGYAQ